MWQKDDGDPPVTNVKLSSTIRQWNLIISLSCSYFPTFLFKSLLSSDAAKWWWIVKLHSNTKGRLGLVQMYGTSSQQTLFKFRILSECAMWVLSFIYSMAKISVVLPQRALHNTHRQKFLKWLERSFMFNDNITSVNLGERKRMTCQNQMISSSSSPSQHYCRDTTHIIHNSHLYYLSLHRFRIWQSHIIMKIIRRRRTRRYIGTRWSESRHRLIVIADAIAIDLIIVSRRFKVCSARGRIGRLSNAPMSPGWVKSLLTLSDRKRCKKFEWIELPLQRQFEWNGCW